MDVGIYIYIQTKNHIKRYTCYIDMHIHQVLCMCVFYNVRLGSRLFAVSAKRLGSRLFGSKMFWLNAVWGLAKGCLAQGSFGSRLFVVCCLATAQRKKATDIQEARRLTYKKQRCCRGDDKLELYDTID